MKKYLFVLFFYLIYFGQYDQLLYGSRPLSMGGAFTAVSDDANAITWNPAGLPGLRSTEFTSTYADLYAMGINQSYRICKTFSRSHSNWFRLVKPWIQR